MECSKIVLMLCGSFYPIHIGHINLLMTASTHYKKIGIEITQYIICPTHYTSLAKKFKWLELEDDTRKETLKDFLENCEWITLDLTLLKGVENIGAVKYVKILCEKFKKQNIKLVQICGVDSKIKFVNNSNNSLVIDDGRNIPIENLQIIKSCNLIKQDYSIYTTSSTIERFIAQQLYPSHTIPSFDIQWLKNTGITLGYGVQGIIQLMLFGTLEVAVKLVQFENNDDVELFYNECEISKICGFTYPKSFVKIYHYGSIVEDDCTNYKNFGYIIMSVGISLNDIIKVKHSYKNKSADKNYKEHLRILNYFTSLTKSQYIEYEQTQFFKTMQKIKEHVENETFFKLDIAIKMFDCVNAISKLSIYHRDIHYNNILLNYDQNELHVMLIDFNVSKKSKSNVCIRRGSLRYYPMMAINGVHTYSHLCDEYMATFVIYELFEEHEIYPELVGDTKEIIKKRKKQIYPEWIKSSKIKEFTQMINKINGIWLNGASG